MSNYKLVFFIENSEEGFKMTTRNSKPGIEGIMQFNERMHSLLDQAIKGLENQELNWRPSQSSNTIGNLLKHIVGSTSFWLLYVAGGLSINRDRPAEFESQDLQIVNLRAELNTLKTVSERVFKGLTDGILAQSRTFRMPWAPAEGAHQVTVHWCLMHAIEHTAGHIGQIFYIRKMYTDRNAD